MLLIAAALMLVGLAGIIIPGLPGNGLIFFTALGYGLITDFEKISVISIFIYGGLTGLSFLFDYMGGILGAKKFGAAKSGIIMGIIGGIVGFIIMGIVGLLLGQFIGTLGGELLSGKKLEVSMKSGLGSLLGYFISVVLNMSIGLLIIATFFISILKG